MGGCSAVNCSNHSRYKHRMFKFPADPARRRIWLVNCHRDACVPGPSSQLCSDHFEESEFEQNRADNWKKLKQTAIPTLFNVPNSPPVIGPVRIEGIGQPKLGSILHSRITDKPKDQEKCSLKSEDGNMITEKEVALQYVPVDECLLHTESSTGNSREKHKDNPVIETFKSLPAVNGRNFSVKENSMKYLESEKEIDFPGSDLTGYHKKKTKSLDLSPDESISTLKGNLAFKNLLENLLVIKKPNYWWTVTPLSDLVICARWNYENFMPEKRVVISSNFSIRVFLKEWEVNISELIDITCIDDISVLLEKVENYKIP